MNNRISGHTSEYVMLREVIHEPVVRVGEVKLRPLNMVELREPVPPENKQQLNPLPAAVGLWRATGVKMKTSSSTEKEPQTLHRRIAAVETERGLPSNFH